MKKITGLGLMSGTSLDGLDICKSTFYTEDKQNFNYKIESCAFFPYPDELVEKINQSPQNNYITVQKLSLELSKFWTDCIKKTNLDKVAYIANHGQTIYHQPSEGLSLQLANHSYMNTQLNIPVIGDFRSGDLHLKGQGAPLVPIGEELLFPEYKAFINMGGFANISYLKNKLYHALDLGPCNIINNILCEQINIKYDENGNIASNYASDLETSEVTDFTQLLQDSLSSKTSLSIEDLDEYKQALLQLPTTKAIALNTTVCGNLIGDKINTLNLDKHPILCTGGGAYNTFLTNLLKNKLKQKLIIPDPTLIDYKEALIFAFIGALKMWNLPFIHSNYTGSTKSHNASSIYTH